MKIIPLALMCLSLSAVAETNTGLSPTGPTTPMSEQTYPHSGQSQNRSDLAGEGNLPISETSGATSTTEKMNTSPTEVPSEMNETEKSNNVLSAGEVYPIGPYKNGQYSPRLGEERQAEEVRLQGGEEEETRVNQMGPNKR